MKHKAKKKSAPPKGNCVPDSKPQNSYKKNMKAAEISRKAGKEEMPMKGRKK